MHSGVIRSCSQKIPLLGPPFGGEHISCSRTRIWPRRPPPNRRSPPPSSDRNSRSQRSHECTKGIGPAFLPERCARRSRDHEQHRALTLRDVPAATAGDIRHARFSAMPGQPAPSPSPPRKEGEPQAGKGAGLTSRDSGDLATRPSAGPTGELEEAGPAHALSRTTMAPLERSFADHMALGLRPARSGGECPLHSNTALETRRYLSRDIVLVEHAAQRNVERISILPHQTSQSFAGEVQKFTCVLVDIDTHMVPYNHAQQSNQYGTADLDGIPRPPRRKRSRGGRVRQDQYGQSFRLIPYVLSAPLDR